MEKKERVATGIRGLDTLMGGGFRRGSTNLLLGGTGTGKTIFAMQFIIEGIEKYNENGVYVSYEEDRQEIFETVLQFGWNLKKYEKEGKFIYIQTTPEQLERVVLTGRGKIKDAVEKINAKRFVIDSITAFVLLNKDELTKREQALSLFRMIKGWGCTALVVSEHEAIAENPSSDDIEYEVDGVILLYHTIEQGVRKRALEILKLRDIKHEEKILPMEITKEGIVVHVPQK